MRQKVRIKFGSYLSVFLIVVISIIIPLHGFADVNEVQEPTEQSSQNQEAVEAFVSSEDIKTTESSDSTESIDAPEITEQTTSSSEKDSQESNSLDNELFVTTDATMMHSGMIGTCYWSIDDSGTLHIGEGSFTNPTINHSPWFTYVEEVKKAVFDGPVSVSGNPAVFRNLRNLEVIENLSFLDVSQCESVQGAFQNTALSVLDLSSFNIGNASSLSTTFSAVENLTFLDASGMDTKNVTSMFGTFLDSRNLQELNISSWDTRKVRSMTSMFQNTDSLKKLVLGKHSVFNSIVDLPSIDTSSGQYNGRWIGLTSGKYFESSTSFMNDYDGTFPDTYVWDQTRIDLHDSIISIGSSWTAKDNFDRSADELGNPVDFENVAVSGDVDTTKAGVNEVSYTYNGLTKVAKITVQAVTGVMEITDISAEVRDNDIKLTAQITGANGGNSIRNGAVRINYPSDSLSLGTLSIMQNENNITNVAVVDITTANQVTITGIDADNLDTAPIEIIFTDCEALTPLSLQEFDGYLVSDTLTATDKYQIEISEQLGSLDLLWVPELFGFGSHDLAVLRTNTFAAKTPLPVYVVVNDSRSIPNKTSWKVTLSSSILVESTSSQQIDTLTYHFGKNELKEYISTDAKEKPSDSSIRDAPTTWEDVTAISSWSSVGGDVTPTTVMQSTSGINNGKFAMEIQQVELILADIGKVTGNNYSGTLTWTLVDAL